MPRTKRFAFVGEEAPGSIGSSSRGDIHVVDVSDLRAARSRVLPSRRCGHPQFLGRRDERRSLRGLLQRRSSGDRRPRRPRDLLANQQATDAASGLVRCDLRLMGRELSLGLTDLNRNVYVWGVQYLNGNVYASDMLNGIWKLCGAL